MAAPNLRSPTVVTGKSACAVLTTGLSEILGNAAASGKVLKVNALRAANVTATAATVSLVVVRATSNFYLLKDGSVSAATALIASDKNEYVYLEEGDSLQAASGVNQAIHLTVNYEEVS